MKAYLKGGLYSVLTWLRTRRRQAWTGRRLEIGPGTRRIEGFETLNIEGGKDVDYVLDATRRLPFRDNSFELIYASHVLEHVPWYQTDNVLREWIRILVPGGQIEIWVPDAFLICRTLVEVELGGDGEIERDGWYRFNEEKDPYKWTSGRIFSYGDGTGNPSSPNWHRALFTPLSLEACLVRAGLSNVRRLRHEEVRGYDHGWLNLGFVGTKSLAKATLTRGESERRIVSR